jgi:hypothetical protein
MEMQAEAMVGDFGRRTDSRRDLDRSKCVKAERWRDEAQGTERRLSGTAKAESHLQNSTFPRFIDIPMLRRNKERESERAVVKALMVKEATRRSDKLENRSVDEKRGERIWSAGKAGKDRE